MASALDRKTIVLAVVLGASPLAAVKADLLRYEFAGAVGYSPNGTVPVGTPIRGRWEVLIPQAGAEYVEPRWEATLYEWQVFDIEIAGEMLEAKEKDLDGFHGIFVSTAETPRTQTGYTTYYQVSSGVLDDEPQIWGADIWRVDALFEFDGRDIWQGSFPVGGEFLNSPLDTYIVIQTNEGSIGGAITTVTESLIEPSPVPVPPASLFYLGFGCFVLAKRVRESAPFNILLQSDA